MSTRTKGKLYALGEAAEYLNVNERYIRNLIQLRKIEFFKLNNGLIRISEDALENFLKGSLQPVLLDAASLRKIAPTRLPRSAKSGPKR